MLRFGATALLLLSPVFGCASREEEKADQQRLKELAAAKAAQQRLKEIVAAETAIARVEKAIEAYTLEHDGQLPAKLELLTVSDGTVPGYLEPKSLLDPWGNPLQWEPNVRHPQSGRVLIFSTGPSPNDATGRIANWQLSPAPPSKPK